MPVSGYDVAAVVEYGLSIPVLTVLWLVSMVAIRRRHDPLRHSFLWLKLAMPLFVISSILNTAGEVIDVVIESLDEDVSVSLFEASWRTFDVATFFSNLTDNFILLLLVELALSFLRAFGNNGIYQQIIRYFNFAIVGILFVLVIAMDGVNENLITESDYGNNNNNVNWSADYNLFGAYYIIYWIFSLPVVVLATFVLYNALQKKQLQTLAACLLAVSLVNLTRTTWNLSYAILYQIGFELYVTFVPQYVLVVSPILYTWFTVVLFLLVAVIGFKKTNGLWSEQQQRYGSEQTQAIPTFQPIGPGSYVPAQQPAPAEMIAEPPVWRAELAGPNYTNTTQQQYYGTQYQQQAPIMQNQVPQGYQAAGVPK